MVQDNSDGSYMDPASKDWYTRFPLPKGFVFYISAGARPVFRDLKRLENADEKRKVIIMDITAPDGPDGMPGHIFINHLRAGFTIDLKKLNRMLLNSFYTLTAIQQEPGSLLATIAIDPAHDIFKVSFSRTTCGARCMYGTDRKRVNGTKHWPAPALP